MGPSAWRLSRVTLTTMDNLGRMYEEIKVQANQLVAKVKELIHEGNVRRIIIKDHSGATFMEIPLTVATVGIIGAPVLAAVGAIATALSDFKIVVERSDTVATGAQPDAPPGARAPGIGATEEQVVMEGTG